MPNFSYVVDSHFTPFTMQEMLVPMAAYKDAFEKSEEKYNELSQNADKFKYLSETLPEDSKARKIYESYANDLRTQAEDLANNGLTMGNRSALTSMRRRYQGEIGMLDKADKALQEEKKLRQTLNAQDPSRLYATNNLSIDDYLYDGNPNLYSVSGNDLYTKGAVAGKAASSRMYSTGEGITTLGGYYRDFMQRHGYNAGTAEAFYEDASTIPELQKAMDDILISTGAVQNLRGADLERARKNVLRGMMDGMIYEESHNPVRDLGKMTAAEQAQTDLANREFNMKKSQMDLQAAKIGYKVDNSGNIVPDAERMKLLQEKKSNKKSNTSSTGSQSTQIIKISWHGNNPNDTNSTKADNDFTTEVLEDATGATGNPTSYDNLPTFVKKQVDKQVGNGSVDDYDYMYQPFEQGFWGGIGNDTETEVTMIPRKTGIKQDNDAIDFNIQ